MSPAAGSDKMWFRVLDRFGLPTLFAVALLWYVLGEAREARRERVETLGQLSKAIDAQTGAFRDLATEEREHAAAVERLAAATAARDTNRGPP